MTRSALFALGLAALLLSPGVQSIMSGPDDARLGLQRPPGGPAPESKSHLPGPPPTIVVTTLLLVDNGDGDGWADTNETVDLWITVYNRMGIDLTGLVARLSTSDSKIACISAPTIAIGDLADRETRRAPEAFRFTVADVDRSTAFEDFSVVLEIEMSADQPVWPLPVRKEWAIDLDLDAAGGAGLTAFFEGFESGFGAFGPMHLDEDLNAPDGDLSNSEAGLLNADGYRCQYSDPDWEPTLISKLPLAVERCFPNYSLPDAFYFQSTDDRAFSGTGAMYYGVPLDPALGFTTPTGQLEAVATTAPINLAWNGVCSITRTLSCVEHVDCPVDEECSPAEPALSIKHQVSLIDFRSTNDEANRALDRAVVQAQLAAEDGSPAGNWIKLEPMLNVYDSEGATYYSSCYFDPIDDGNTEEDFFDPADPERLLGPSSTCYPEYTFADIGETGSLFESTSPDIGDASDGPGLEGNAGIGTWIESRFDLGRFRARRIRLRFLATGLGARNDATWESFFRYNPDPRDDGWFFDDVTVTDTLTDPATVTVDDKPNNDVKADQDLDTVAATCDCAPDDETAWVLPGEATDLVLSAAGGVTNLSWQPPADPGGTAVLYDLLAAAAPYDFAGTGFCVASGGADPAAMDASVPGPDLVQYYLARARHTCGNGPLGIASSGDLRSGVTCP